MAAPSVTRRVTERTGTAARAGTRGATTWRTVLDRVETASWLDRLGNPIQRAVQAVVRGRARDALHGVWFGHPFHPVAVMVPLGAWMSAAALDLLRGGNRAANLLIGIGAAGAVPAAAAGLNDWASLAREQRRVGLVHASANSVALGLYVASLAARRRGRPGRLLAYGGLAAASAGGYIGGHLSYRQAAGMNQAAPLLRQIPAGWHDVCGYEDLQRGRPVSTRLGDVPVLAVHTGDGVTVMIERCAHQGGPLGEGERTQINGADCVICPWHGSTFRLSDGAAVRGPAANSQPLLRSRVVNGRVEAAVP